MPNVEVLVNRKPQAAMADAKEFVASSDPRGPELSGCKPPPPPPGPPVCRPCTLCNAPTPPHDRP